MAKHKQKQTINTYDKNKERTANKGTHQKTKKRNKYNKTKKGKRTQIIKHTNKGHTNKH